MSCSFFDASALPVDNTALQSAALNHFCPFGTTEVEVLFRTTYSMLRELKPDDATFLEQFDFIVFGTMAMAIAIEERKYSRSQQFSAIHTLISLRDKEGTANTILAVGKQLKTKDITLTVAQIENEFPELIKVQPVIKYRLYALTHPTSSEPIAETASGSTSSPAF